MSGRHDDVTWTRRAFGAGLGLAAGATVAGCRSVAARPIGAGKLESPPFASPFARRFSEHVADVPLVSHRGESVRFRSDRLRDSIAVVSFMYVHCDGSCPATNRLVRDLRPELTRWLGDGVRFLSVTLDPERDDPATLADYATHYDAGPRVPGLADWEFFTGRHEDIEALRRSLGYWDPDPKIDADRTSHAALVTFGNDLIDRWSALPVGISFGQTVAAILKCCSRDPDLQWGYRRLAAAGARASDATGDRR